MDNKVKEVLIGEFELSGSLNEVAKVGTLFPLLGKKHQCQIYVKEKEGPICHFHVLDKSEDFRMCVCIYEPCYFIHPGWEGKLNSSQKKELDSYLRTDGYIGKTIWDDIVFQWRKLNPNNYNYYKYEKNFKGASQPDYTRLDDNRVEKH